MIRSDTPAHARLGLDDVRVRMIYRTIAFCHALRHQLRDTRGPDDLQPLLRPAEWGSGLQGIEPVRLPDAADGPRPGRLRPAGAYRQHPHRTDR